MQLIKRPSDLLYKGYKSSVNYDGEPSVSNGIVYQLPSSPYIQHAVCCAHLLRELTGIDENHPEQKWASAFIDLLPEMKKVKGKAVEKGKDFLSYYHYHKFDKKYDELIEQARKENPLPETTEKKHGRKKKEKSLPL